MSGTRAFVAIELDSRTSGLLAAAGAALRDVDSRWRGEKWVPEANLHITLKFLGSLNDQQIVDLRLRLDSVLADQEVFQLALDGLRAVPSRSRSSMVWAAFRDTPRRDCARLAAQIDRAAATVGVEPDTRPFKPHVTLVRARRARTLRSEALNGANALLETDARFMSVPSATLFASTLTPHGPVYEALQSWAFRPVGEVCEDS